MIERRQDDRSATHEQERTTQNEAAATASRKSASVPSFGTEHHFRVRADDRHFEYGGYAFEYVDVWPQTGQATTMFTSYWSATTIPGERSPPGNSLRLILAD